MKRREKVGWLYRTEGTPPYIKAEVKAINGKDSTAFADNEEGARECARWVTLKLGRDDWTLEDMLFLGYRIVVPVLEEGEPS